MENASSNSTPTIIPPSTVYIPTFMDYIFYIGLVHYFFGLLGNLVSIRAFAFQAKSNSAYFHQVLIFVTDTVIILLNIGGNIEFVIYGWRSPAKTFVSMILRMMCWPIANVGWTVSVLVMIGLTLDRLRALTAPLEYHKAKYDHKRRAIKLGICSCLVAFPCHGALLLRAVLAEASVKTFFMYKSLSKNKIFFVFVSIPRIFDAILLTTLLVLFVRLIINYGEVRKTKLNPAGSSQGTGSSRPVDQATLTMLLMAQLVLVWLGVGFRTIRGLLGNLSSINGALETVVGVLLPISKIFSNLQVNLNVWIYIALSKEFRKAVKRVLCGGKSSGEVTAIGTAQNAQGNLRSGRLRKSQGSNFK